MRERRMGIVLAAAALAACGGDAGQEGAAVVDSGMAATPALDSAGGTTNSHPGRSD